MKKILAFALIFIAFKLNAQIGPDLYLIEFTDKNNTPYSLNNPQDFLSERAINRRTTQHIAIDSLDLPVNASYIEALEDLGLEIHNVSKWLNSAVVRTEDYNLVLEARNLPFVKNESRFEIDTVQNRGRTRGQSKETTRPIPVHSNKNIETTENQKFESTDYGGAYPQIAIHNGHMLHSEGYKGEGMLIAVIDGGFINADQMPSLSYLRNNNRIIATRDFAYGDGNVYAHHTHGAMVLSLMAGYLPGEYIGTAPEAEYLLITSECDDYEEIVEEFNWVSAIEYADSMGADVANVSLGYVDFDSERYNHAYEDMDGQKCPSSIGAEIAASRGMLVVVAAGNSGNDENGHVWIGAPSDAQDVITVGAISVYETIAPFTSHGFCTENRIKPDVASIGWGTYVDYVGDSISYGNGTSFATPIMCGLTACFWQKFHDKTGAEIREALYEAAHSISAINSPNIFTGRGIVDFNAASSILTENKSEQISDANFEIKTDSSSRTMTISSEEELEINIFSSTGHLVDSFKAYKGTTNYNYGRFADGLYIVSFSSDNKVVKTIRIIKQ